MSNIPLTTEPLFAEKLASYPEPARSVLERLRDLVHQVVAETPALTSLTETLKWGEPSFVTPQGTTLRMDWKKRSPDTYAFYVSCSSQLIPTFRVVFGSELDFTGNRGILFRLDEEVPVGAVKQCIKTALTYHRVKHLPLLGL
jgi:hypothetical protein